MKILMISNLYPNEEYPYYGTFVKNFYEYIKNKEQENKELSIEKVVFDKKRGTVKKVINYFKFYIKSLYKIYTGKWDIVYIHYVSHSSIPILLSPKKYKIISNIHGSDYIAKSKMQQIMNFFGKKLLNKSDLIVVPSKYYGEILRKDYPKTEIFESSSGGIDKDVFYKDIDEEKNKDVFNLGYVGRIDTGKGWNTLLKAMQNIENEQIKLTIIGSGKEEKKLHELILQYDLLDRVLLIPGQSQKNLKKYYNNFDLFVFPSENTSESLGLVGIEAMACGVPVIGSNLGGIKTFLIDGYNGFLFESKNSFSLSESIEKFLTLSVDEKKKMSNNAINTSVEYDSQKVNFELLERILKVVE